ncbi:MAG: type VI secretion system baseplate subunit TssE [Pseudomonadota bacterium]
MVDKLVSERLQPSLLDRLTDQKPESPEESRDERVIDMRRLRAIVLRDLTWLFNTTNFASVRDLKLMPQSAASVINYGIPDVAGQQSGQNWAFGLQRALRDAIERFEPRLIPGTVEILLGEQNYGRDAVIVLEIRGELWAHPMPIELYMRTELDLANGEITVRNET